MRNDTCTRDLASAAVAARNLSVGGVDLDGPGRDDLDLWVRCDEPGCVDGDIDTADGGAAACPVCDGEGWTDGS